MLRARGARSLGPPPIALSTPARTPTPTRATDVERISEATPAPGRSGASSSDQSGDGGQVQKRMPGPSVKLASIVLGLALVVVVGGLLAQGFAGPSAPTPAPANVATAKGSPLKAIPARSDLAPLIADGEPPDDIVNAVVLPAGSLPGTVINDTNSAESYDEQRLFTLTSSQRKSSNSSRSSSQPRAGTWRARVSRRTSQDSRCWRREPAATASTGRSAPW